MISSVWLHAAEHPRRRATRHQSATNEGPRGAAIGTELPKGHAVRAATRVEFQCVNRPNLLLRWGCSERCWQRRQATATLGIAVAEQGSGVSSRRRRLLRRLTDLCSYFRGTSAGGHRPATRHIRRGRLSEVRGSSVMSLNVCLSVRQSIRVTAQAIDSINLCRTAGIAIATRPVGIDGDTAGGGRRRPQANKNKFGGALVTFCGQAQHERGFWEQWGRGV